MYFATRSVLKIGVYLTIIPRAPVGYEMLYNNQINARALIGQSAVDYCYYKPTENPRVF